MSKPPRFFISPSQVQGRRISLSGDDLRHIRTVLRKGPGDLLTLLDGQEREYTVTIVSLERAEIVTEIVTETNREIRHPCITLGQGLPKSDKMDFIVQKATELGVSDIVPLVAERTIVKIKDEEKRVSRWRKIAKEAAMQSNRSDIPVIEPIRSMKEFIRTLDPGPLTLQLFPWEESTQPIKEVLRAHPDVKTITVLIGPEGGFSSFEADMAKEKGFHLVSLGPNLLRTETAAIAALSMLLYERS